MSHEPNDKLHLTPRQIINRYCKGEYVDESIEAISSAISSCRQPFNCNAVPFPTSIIDKVYEYISLSKAMYEKQKEGKGIEDIDVPDYPQLKEILQDLSYPALWESMKAGVTDITFMENIREKGLNGKYVLDTRQSSCSKATSIASLIYGSNVEHVGLSSVTLSLCLNMMIK